MCLGARCSLGTRCLPESWLWEAASSRDSADMWYLRRSCPCLFRCIWDETFAVHFFFSVLLCLRDSVLRRRLRGRHVGMAWAPGRALPRSTLATLPDFPACPMEVPLFLPCRVKWTDLPTLLQTWLECEELELALAASMIGSKRSSSSHWVRGCQGLLRREVPLSFLGSSSGPPLWFG